MRARKRKQKFAEKSREIELRIAVCAEQGMSVIDAMKVIRDEFGCDLGRAMRAAACHPKYEAWTRAHDEFVEEICRALVEDVP